MVVCVILLLFIVRLFDDLDVLVSVCLVLLVVKVVFVVGLLLVI